MRKWDQAISTFSLIEFLSKLKLNKGLLCLKSSVTEEDWWDKLYSIKSSILTDRFEVTKMKEQKGSLSYNKTTDRKETSNRNRASLYFYGTSLDILLHVPVEIGDFNERSMHK